MLLLKITTKIKHIILLNVNKYMFIFIIKIKFNKQNNYQIIMWNKYLLIIYIL